MLTETRAVRVVDLFHDRQVRTILAVLRDPKCRIPRLLRLCLILWAHVLRIPLLLEATVAQRLWDRGEKVEAIARYTVVFGRMPKNDCARFMSMNPHARTSRAGRSCL